MSASEKLKALDAGCTEWDGGDPWGDGMEVYIEDGQPPIAALRNALPQIVAVIESAERETGMEDDTEEARMRNVPRLRAALTALEGVLDGE